MALFEFQLRLDVKKNETAARQLESRNRTLEMQVQEKEIAISRYEADIRHLQGKIENMESIHRKEIEAQNERVNRM